MKEKEPLREVSRISDETGVRPRIEVCPIVGLLPLMTSLGEGDPRRPVPHPEDRVTHGTFHRENI